MCLCLLCVSFVCSLCFVCLLCLCLLCENVSVYEFVFDCVNVYVTCMGSSLTRPRWSRITALLIHLIATYRHNTLRDIRTVRPSHWVDHTTILTKTHQNSRSDHHYTFHPSAP